MQFLKKFLNVISNKLFIIALLILIQLALYILPAILLSINVLKIDSVFRILAILIVLYIVEKNDNPSYKITWIICILILPAFGVSLYFIFGNKKVPQKLIERDEELSKVMNHYLIKEEPLLEELKKEDPRAYKQSQYLFNASEFPIYKDTATHFYKLGEDQFEDMIRIIKDAKNFIFMEFFIINEGEMWNTLLELLKEKAKEGIDVRILYDDLGCINTFSIKKIKQIEKDGIKIKSFNPIKPRLAIQMNNRDHRKIVVVDDKYALTGGINISDEYINKKERFGHWKDSGCALYGEAVWSFTFMFLQFWNYDEKEENTDDYMKYHVHSAYFKDKFNDGYVQPFSDQPTDDENVGESVHINMINAASDYVYITTPYLVLDNEMKTALTLASKNGVDVRILVPHVPDKKYVFLLTQANYKELTKCGVKIYEYVPGFIHAKTFVADDRYAVVGTVNMDFRSYYLHYECGCFFYKSSLIKDMKEDYLETLKKSKEITYEDCMNKNVFIRIGISLMHLIAPLM